MTVVMHTNTALVEHEAYVAVKMDDCVVETLEGTRVTTRGGTGFVGFPRETRRMKGREGGRLATTTEPRVSCLNPRFASRPYLSKPKPTRVFIAYVTKTWVRRDARGGCTKSRALDQFPSGLTFEIGRPRSGSTRSPPIPPPPSTDTPNGEPAKREGSVPSSHTVRPIERATKRGVQSGRVHARPLLRFVGPTTKTLGREGAPDRTARVAKPGFRANFWKKLFLTPSRVI